jgi:YD repeat-containing protein
LRSKLGEQRPENGYQYVELATLTGAQLTRGTLEGKETVGFQLTSQNLVNALADNVMKVKITNVNTTQATPRINLWFYGQPSVFGSGFDDTVPAAAPVSFQYDNAGNRTSMTDELGTVTYAYDQLSRLTSEIRQISSISQSYTLTYTYSLSQLKTITDGFNATVTYTHDKAGRLTHVNSPNYGLSSPFMTGVRYRSWGAMKEADFGYGGNLDLTYNNRLLPTEFKVTGTANGQPYTRGSAYTYYADAQLKKSDDLANNRFDRTYKYDHAARLKDALSGFEARGETNPDPYPNRPYKQIYAYDAYNHRTGGEQRFWRADLSYIVQRTFVNGRDPNTAYDADGRQLTNRVNAAGKPTENISRDLVGGLPSANPTQPAFEIYQKFDGDGNIGNRTEVRRADETNGTVSEVTSNTYYIRSSVLGGKPVAEVDAVGAKSKGHIYANGALLARQIGFCNQCTPYVYWEETNPLTGGQYEAFADGSGIAEERDPTGANTGTEDPYAFQDDPMYQDLLGINQQPLFLESGGNPFDPNSPYQIDGLPVSFEEFQRRLGGGSVGADVYRDGRFIGQVSIIGGLIRGPNHISVQLPDIYYFRDRDFGPALGVHPELNIQNGGSYFIDTTGYATNQAQFGLKFSQGLVNSVRKELTKILTADCLSKLSTIMREAERLAAGTPNADKAVSYNPLMLFDEVAKQGGFYFGNNSGGFQSISTAVGAVGAGMAAISITSQKFSNSYSTPGLRNLAYDVMSETFHIAGSKMNSYAFGTFSDVNMAKASHASGLGAKNFANFIPRSGTFLTQFPGDANVDPFNDPNNHWSDYNHKSIQQFCR